MSTSRKVFVLVPVEVDVYAFEDEPEHIGSIRMPNEKEVKHSLSLGLGMEAEQVPVIMEMLGSIR